MNTSTTPRTDAETCIWSGRKIFVNKSLALKLEMELAVSLENQVKAQAEIERLRKENDEFLISEAALSEELKICDDWLVHTRHENARLRELLNQAIDIAETLSGGGSRACRELHHAKKDRHESGDVCPVEERLEKAVSDLANLKEEAHEELQLKEYGK